MKIKPGKPLSAGAVFGLVFMVLFGIGFGVLVMNVLIENDAPLVMKIIFPLFIVAWIGGVIFMLVYHVRNLKNAKGVSLIDIETGSDMQKDPMQRLRDLETLKNDRLITDDEFKKKRTEIMGEKW
ncbi:MAG: hypothetical protein C4538_07570 [Nitrospiraceae bacterium]|nr:MAG: hypothetical protein C4538_07570 [Nitrospiraceae bacterium]